MSYKPIVELEGKTFISVEGCEKGSEKITFLCSNGQKFDMFHYQDCCERVDVEDVCGNVEDIANTRIISAEECSDSSGESDDPEIPLVVGEESYTWTFYRFRTIKGTVVIRWLGRSNGYYSESVQIEECN